MAKGTARHFMHVSPFHEGVGMSVQYPGSIHTHVGRHRVRRLMAKMGLEAIYKRPRTSQPHPQRPVYPYLLGQMQIDRPNQVPLSGSCCA